MKVFISYRRDDSIIHAKLIRNELAARFGDANVFMDIDDIDYGEDFARKIDKRLDAAGVVVAVIGPHWAEMLQQRLRSDDYVRYELARSLARGIRVVPVLVDKAPPPDAGLPADLAPLRTLNALNLDPRALTPHLNALVETVQGRSFEDVARDLQRRLRSQRLAQWTGAGVGLATFFAGWVALFDFVGLDTRLASVTMSLAAAGRRAPWSEQVVLVAIDEGTVQRIGRPFDASWRREHAQLVGKLAAAGARTVAFDLFFEQPAAAADDAAFVTAVRTARPMPVVFGVRRMRGDQTLLLPPLAALGAGGLACLGEKLGYARSMPLAMRHGSVLLPALALAAYSGGGRVEALDAPARQLRVRVVPEQKSADVRFAALEQARAAQAGCEAVRAGDELALQWLDPQAWPDWRAPVRRLAYEQVLNSADAAALAGVKDKIVLVGLQLPDTDVLVLPRAGNRWGVEVIAGQIDALVRGEAVRTLGPWASLSTMLLVAAVGAFTRRAVSGRSQAIRLAVVGVGVLTGLAVALALYRFEHLLINVAYVVAAFLLAWWAMAWLEARGMP